MKVKVFLILIISVAIIMCGCTSPQMPEEDNPGIIYNTMQIENTLMRGAWIATVFGIDFPKRATTDSKSLKTEIDEIVSKSSEMGLNALFFQVRPCADAFYKSQIFPWSKYLTGEQGQAPTDSFDPLEYIIAKCHALGIQLHAWINPYRVTTLVTDKVEDTRLMINVSGKCYFNPAEPQAQQLIKDGVREIILNYDIDGIHFDDYFYPEGITNEDYDSWTKYGGGFECIADWRRNNVDELIKQTYCMIKEIKPSVMFGISPSGIWANSTSNKLGSNTRGFESYSQIYADSRGWVKSGWVDYIAPQIYWYIGQSGSDFLTVANWWCDVCSDTEVKLYSGIASYKNFSEQEYVNQKLFSNELANGYILFSFSDLRV